VWRSRVARTKLVFQRRGEALGEAVLTESQKVDPVLTAELRAALPA
jgi:hypothetical protein